jgi:protein-S-isoprenylcysteine O-methyltransferase Ste14
VSAVVFGARRPVVTRVATSAPVALLWLLFAAANFGDWRSTHRPTGLGATALELVVAALFVLRRSPFLVSRSRLAWGAAAIGTFGMLAARPAYDPVGGLGGLYSGMQIAGAIFASVALLSLGRSFGLVPANRGIRTGGLYRYVRHPVYSGYILAGLGYVLENPSLQNSCVFGIATAFQGVRIVEEERTLAEDPAYQAYSRRVRSRVVPYLL